MKPIAIDIATANAITRYCRRVKSKIDLKCIGRRWNYAAILSSVCERTDGYSGLSIFISLIYCPN